MPSAVLRASNKGHRVKKYLITGFSGFVGRHFLDYLNSLNEPISVLGIDRDAVNFDFNQFGNLECAFKKADLLQSHEWEPLIELFQPDYIVHLASFSSVAFSWVNPIQSFANNTNVFLNLLETVRKVNPRCRILSIGSSEEYGACALDQLPLTEDAKLNPVSPYAVARVSQELLSTVYVDGFGCDIVMTRSFNHIGPGQLDTFVISSFARKLLAIQNGSADAVMLTGDTTIVRDFVDVRDVVRAYDQLLRQGRSGHIYNICSGTGVALKSVIDQMASILGISVVQKIDPQLVRPNDNKAIIGSLKKINDEIGWAPSIPLDTSLRDILNYWRNKSLA
ncbi:GDP-4-dehydro-6-deoxy-D-mannose reductase [Rhodoferax ferrireducens]|uniref:GDP-4-dehydro-6-deoxy-D-mannose reductase n=1 Tax=Rhodoferax ferrireducens TaxID=192843 RepID=A0ABU2C8T7_9BURK|nr:GDP-mannose 4,6-dehydratase [Rhodoferax ferrireducens]MDR7377733.1 GDP-4-dehydro-6-deoxy-D-mannose reductase [Rhodoferax ferrireducens]